MHFVPLVALALAAGCDGPPMLGTIGAAIVVSPVSHDFGLIDVGATAPPRIVNVSPSTLGLDDDVINAVSETCGDFELDLTEIVFPAEVYKRCTEFNGDLFAAPCPQGFEVQSQHFWVRFHPSFAGAQGCTITVDLQNAGPRTINVSGTGVAPPVALTVLTPASLALAFGDVVLGSQSGALPVTVRSDGASPLDLGDATLSGPDAAAFTIATTGSEPLDQGQTFTWQLTCTPAAPTTLHATLTIDSNAPDRPHQIELACSGIQSNLTVAPSPLQFAETLIGADRTGSIELGNSGTAALTITATQMVTGPFSAPDLAGIELAPGAMLVALPITFTPTAADVDTDVRGSLVVTFNAGNDSRTIDLVGPARTAALSLTPPGALDLGTVCGGQSREQLFVALNSGSGAVDLLDASVTGPGFTLTPIAPSSYPAPLPARGGGSASFRVVAMPPTGDAIGELTVTTAIPGSAPTVVPLHAIGQDSGVGASPLAIDFGGVEVDVSSGGQTVRISNCEPATLELIAATITGPNAGEFVLVAVDQQVPGTLATGASAVFAVDLRPRSGGDKIATLELVHSAGTTSIPLTGTGVGAELPAGGGADRGSYYACNAGGGATGLAPLALALLALRRRRRTR